MNHRTEVPPDTEFLRNTGLALVFLTLLAGSISLVGSLSTIPAHIADINSYGIEPAQVTELKASAD